MRVCLCFAAALFLVFPALATGQENPDPIEAPSSKPPSRTEEGITLELNKLLPTENACLAYFVVSNHRSEPLQELETDVYLFDKQDIAMRGVILRFADVGPGRTIVFPFELTELRCDDIARLIINRVLVCNSANGAPIEGCADDLSVNTRAEAVFEY